MRNTVVAVLMFGWLSGCSSNAGYIQFMCANNNACGGALGVGGHLPYFLYTGDHFADGARLVPTNAAIVGPTGTTEQPALLGEAAGMTEVHMVDASGKVTATATVSVAALTGLRIVPIGKATVTGPMPDATYDGQYVVAAGQPFEVNVAPQVGATASIGNHFFDVSVDGGAHDCFGQPRQCTGSITTDWIYFDPLAVGDHILALHGQDGTRDFTFRITAQ